MDIYATIDKLQQKALELLQQDDKNRKLLEELLRHKDENGDKIKKIKKKSPIVVSANGDVESGDRIHQLIDKQQQRHDHEFQELHDEIDELIIKIDGLQQLFDDQKKRHGHELQKLQEEIEKLTHCIIKIGSLK